MRLHAGNGQIAAFTSAVSLTSSIEPQCLQNSSLPLSQGGLCSTPTLFVRTSGDELLEGFRTAVAEDAGCFKAEKAFTHAYVLSNEVPILAEEKACTRGAAGSQVR